MNKNKNFTAMKMDQNTEHDPGQIKEITGMTVVNAEKFATTKIGRSRPHSRKDSKKAL